MRWLLPTLVLLPALAAAQETGHWQLPKDARRTLTWDYSLEERTTHSDDGAGFTKETRKVTARLHAPEAVAGKGELTLTLATVDWTVSTADYTVALSLREGEAPAVELTVHREDERPSAEQLAEEMEDVVQRTHRLRVRPGEASIQVKSADRWAGGADAPTVFDRCYLQSALPDGELKSNRSWIDAREAEYLPLYHQTGKAEEVPQIKLKLQLGKDGLRVKGSGKASFTGRTMLNWKYVGKSTVKRSFSCTPDGVLAESSEEQTSKVKRTNMTRKGKSSGNLKIAQSLRIEG